MPGDSSLKNFGKYTQIKEVGRGGFGIVYRALDTTLDRTVALKFPYPELLRDPVFVRQFQAEARVAAQLDHPNIVHIHAVGDWQGTPYIEMEYVNGPTLAGYLAQRKRLSPRESLAILAPVCDALDFAHGRGIVHRDIKPGNILSRADDMRVLVGDFGIAKALNSSSVQSSMRMTGTAHYMAPEQASPALGQVGPASDVYSLGVVLFELLTGQTPFQGSDAFQVAMQHVLEPPPSLRQLNPQIDLAVESVVLRALAKRPEDRFASAGALATAMRNAIQNKVAVPVVDAQPGQAVPTPQRPPRRSRMPVLIALILPIILIAVVALALAQLPNSQSTQPPPAATAAATVPTYTPTPASDSAAAALAAGSDVTASPPAAPEVTGSAPEPAASATPVPESTLLPTATDTPDQVAADASTAALSAAPATGAASTATSTPQAVAAAAAAEARSAAAPSGAKIVVDGADTTWSSQLSQSDEVDPLAQAVVPRIVVGNANAVASADLLALPAAAAALVEQVAPRVEVLYANALRHFGLTPPGEALTARAQGVAGRVQIDNASTSRTVDLRYPQALLFR